MSYRKKTIICVFSFFVIRGGTFLAAQEKKIDQIQLEKAIGLYRDQHLYKEALDEFSKVLENSVDSEMIFQAYLYISNIHFILNENDAAMANVKKMCEFKQEFALSKNEFNPDFIKFVELIKEGQIGIVYFDTVPQAAKILIDKIEVGVTPIKKELLAKKYFLRVIKWGYSPLEFTIDIIPHEITSIKFDLNLQKNWKSFSRSALLMLLLSVAISRT